MAGRSKWNLPRGAFPSWDGLGCRALLPPVWSSTAGDTDRHGGVNGAKKQGRFKRGGGTLLTPRIVTRGRERGSPQDTTGFPRFFRVRVLCCTSCWSPWEGLRSAKRPLLPVVTNRAASNNDAHVITWTTCTRFLRSQVRQVRIIKDLVGWG